MMAGGGGWTLFWVWFGMVLPEEETNFFFFYFFSNLFAFHSTILTILLTNLNLPFCLFLN